VTNPSLLLLSMRGLIIRSQSGFYLVHTDEGDIVCHLRGRLTKGPRLGDIAAVGDWVRVTRIDSKKGMIEEIEPRQRLFSRLAPNPQGVYQQVLIANPDQVVLVFACAQPAPRLGMLDRFLVIAEKQGVPPVIVANKLDLVDAQQAEACFERYAALDYPLFYTSAATGQGMPGLQQRLAGRISLFTGPSGVGKTSLLNCLQPGLGLEVRQVSRATSKGRHTTVVREMFPLDQGGYVADTPGLRALALWDVEPEEVDGYFPELRSLVNRCQFNDCTHLHEPGCAVQAAVATGQVHPERYIAYLRMRFGEEVI
jgi:ribosome biogenesis GTPase